MSEVNLPSQIAGLLQVCYLSRAFDETFLAPIIAFLKDLPCSCGEHGSIEAREYIRYAAQLAEIVKP